jgi:DNA-binding protein H-NS
MSTVQTATKDKARESHEPEKGKKTETKAEPSLPSTAQALHPAQPSAVENLAALTDEGLSTRLAEAHALVAEVEREMDQRRAKKQAEILASLDTQLDAIRTQALAAGLDPVTVSAALAKFASGKRSSTRARSSRDARSAVAKKYRNPENPSQTWAGRGAVPKWIELEPAKPGEKRGKPLAKFLIPTSS